MKKKYRKTGELKIFREIVISRGAYSQVSGTPIIPITVSSMAHILPKGGRFPEARLDARNIIILTPKEHTQLDTKRWEVKDDPRWSFVWELEEELLKKYIEKKPH